eukprot:scaffold11431_cov118-Isochrysis_galbana.AAC.2
MAHVGKAVCVVDGGGDVEPTARPRVGGAARLASGRDGGGGGHGHRGRRGLAVDNIVFCEPEPPEPRTLCSRRSNLH